MKLRVQHSDKSDSWNHNFRYNLYKTLILNIFGTKNKILYSDAGDNLPNILLRSPPRDAQIIPEAKTTPQAGSEQFSSSPIKISSVLSSPGALSYCGGELESPLALTSPYRSPFR